MPISGKRGQLTLGVFENVTPGLNKLSKSILETDRILLAVNVVVQTMQISFKSPLNF